MVFTSGTTGRPKASQVVHRCSVHSGMSYQRVLQLQPGEVTAVLFPMYYISAMHAHVLPALLAGATCVLVDTTSPARLRRRAPHAPRLLGVRRAQLVAAGACGSPPSPTCPR